MEFSTSIRRAIQSLSFLFLIYVLGTIGYMLIEKYSLLDATYMTVITMSTVGFGTIGELSQTGKIFSVLLIVMSAGTFVYALTTLTAFVVEGEMQQMFKRYKVEKRVAKIEDHVIICGLGRNGREAALELLRQGQPCVIIEMKQEVADDFLEHHKDALVLLGDATNEEMMDKANIYKARGLISALSTDAENVYITLTARVMNPKVRIVARASNESTTSKLRRAGADQVILPNIIGGRKMVNLITRPALVEFMEIVTGEGDPNLHLEEVYCANRSGLVGRSLSELHIRAKTGVLVIGYMAGEGKIELNPPPNRIIRHEDRMFVLGTWEQFALFRELYM